MAALDTTPPLTRDSVIAAHAIVKPYIHHTPVLTNTTLNNIASTPQSSDALEGTEWEGQEPAKPKIRLFFKCENLQRIGAFKVRGAFHAVRRLVKELGRGEGGEGGDEEKGLEELRRRGVVTHSSGNHAQATALAARTFAIPAHIIMPRISTPSKIAGTQAQGANVHFSGSTSVEREAVVKSVQEQTGAILVPPYDHPDIMLGQGTLGVELEAQYSELVHMDPELSVHSDGGKLDAVITPCGGGGMLSGTAIYFHGTGTRVFGAEPSFEGADDARRGVAAGKRVETVKSLTIGDGLRTPLGEHTYDIISNKEYVQGLYAVTEEQIKSAMKLVLERMKVVVEPSAVVGLATILYNEEFRRMVEKEAGEEGWDIGVVFSGGNTTVEAIGKLFAVEDKGKAERAEGTKGADGGKVAENVAG